MQSASERAVEEGEVDEEVEDKEEGEDAEEEELEFG